jgi:hypothetical protein
MIIGIFLFFLLIFAGLAIYARITAPKARREIPLKIESYPTVLKAEILFDEGFINCEFYIDILFTDGGKLEISGVNEWGKGPITIKRIGSNKICILKRNGGYLKQEAEMELWSNITGLHLESEMDLIKNYYLIARCTEEWPDLSEYKESIDEKFIKVKKRICENPPKNSKIIFEGEEYILAKYVIGSFEFTLPLSSNYQ